MNKLVEAIEKIGMKKLCLFFHYALGGGTTLLYLLLCGIATFLPATYDVSALTYIWQRMLIYVCVVVGYITILCIFESLQTMNKARTKFDFIAFFIGFSMFVTLGLIIVCVVFMFTKSINEIEFKTWQFIIGVFGGMFITEAGGGYLYKGYKNKLGINKEEPPVEEPPQEN